MKPAVIMMMLCVLSQSSAHGFDLFSPKVGTTGKLDKGVQLKVFQVIDSLGMLVYPESPEREGDLLLFLGFSTSGVKPGERFSTTRQLKVSRSDNYVAKSGRTVNVYVIEPVPGPRRRWTIDGEQFIGRFLHLSKGNATIIMDDGSTHSYDVNVLSPADKLYISKQ